MVETLLESDHISNKKLDGISLKELEQDSENNSEGISLDELFEDFKDWSIDLKDNVIFGIVDVLPVSAFQLLTENGLLDNLNNLAPGAVTKIGIDKLQQIDMTEVKLEVINELPNVFIENLSTEQFQNIGIDKFSNEQLGSLSKESVQTLSAPDVQNLAANGRLSNINPNFISPESLKGWDDYSKLPPEYISCIPIEEFKTIDISHFTISQIKSLSTEQFQHIDIDKLSTEQLSGLNKELVQTLPASEVQNLAVNGRLLNINPDFISPESLKGWGDYSKLPPEYISYIPIEEFKTIDISHFSRNQLSKCTKEQLSMMPYEQGKEQIEKIIPDQINWEEIKNDALESGAWGAGFGVFFGPIGVAIGASIGVAVGAVGEATRQIMIHNGYSEEVAQYAEIGINITGPGGVAKAAFKEVGEQVLKHGDEILKGTDEVTEIVRQYDDVARFAQDKVKTIGFEAKGIVKNLQTHEFVDGLGKQLIARMDDVIDLSRTVKMPYIGSHMDNVNSAGFLRDKAVFAKEYLREFPETLSANNIERIKNGLAPIVDKQWLKFNPNHKTFMGEILEHHHINNTNLAAYVPASLHRGKFNKDILHMDNKALGQELLNATKNIITGRS